MAQIYDNNGNPIDVGGSVNIVRQLLTGTKIASINGIQLYAPPSSGGGGEEIVTTHIVCRRYGTEGVDCDFAGLNAIHRALKAISDNSYYNRYVIHATGHFVFNQVCFTEGGVDVTTDYWDSVTGATVRAWQGQPNEWLANVYGKDYVTIDGGSRENTSIEVYLNSSTQFPLYPNNSEHYNGTNFHVCFNACHWAEFKNITFVGYNTRYLLHTESADESDFVGSYALFDNCRFVYFKDKTWTRDGGSTTNVFNANSLFGFGLRTNYDWHFENCEFNQNCISPTVGSHIGFHTGYLIDSARNTVRDGARAHFKGCKFFGSPRVVQGSSYYGVTDYIYFESCEFPTGSFINAIVTYQQSNTLKVMPPRIITDGKHVSFNPSGTNNVLAINYTGSTTKVRVAQSCTAFGLFSYTLYDYDQLVDLQRDLDGARVFNGYSAKDGVGGYLIGEKAISMDKQGTVTLASILGDCSSTSKTLSLYINDTLVSKTLNANYSSMSDVDIITALNTLFSQNSITFTLFNITQLENLITKNSQLAKNVSGDVVTKGAGVVFVNANDFRLAESGEEIDGICLSYSTPNNEYAHISKGGEYGSILGATYSEGKYYEIGSTNGSFVQTNDKTPIKAVNGIFQFLK